MTSEKNQSWLLLFNCQTPGLASSLRLLSPGLEVDAYDPGRFRRHRAEVLERLPSYDLVLVHPLLVGDLADRGNAENVRVLPSVAFDAFTPDGIFVNERPGGKLLAGPIGDFHSAIGVAAFRLGLSVEETLGWFNAETYKRIGYLDRWVDSRDVLVGTFREAGYDISGPMLSWSRSGVFMHTFNHPHIRVLYDLATVILETHGMPVVDSPVTPHDNLANGPVLPVYPEVGRTLGVAGGYNFKRPGAYSLISLADYIEGSFQAMRDAEDATPSPAFRKFVDGTVAVMKEDLA